MIHAALIPLMAKEVGSQRYPYVICADEAERRELNQELAKLKNKRTHWRFVVNREELRGLGTSVLFVSSSLALKYVHEVIGMIIGSGGSAFEVDLEGGTVSPFKESAAKGVWQSDQAREESARPGKTIAAALRPMEDSMAALVNRADFAAARERLRAKAAAKPRPLETIPVAELTTADILRMQKELAALKARVDCDMT